MHWFLTLSASQTPSLINACMLCQRANSSPRESNLLASRPNIMLHGRRTKPREGKGGRKGKRSLERRVNPNFYKKLERRV
jgi:hypothetical protein